MAFPSGVESVGSGSLSTNFIPSSNSTVRTRWRDPKTHDGRIVHFALNGCRLSHRWILCPQSTLQRRNLASSCFSISGSTASGFGCQFSTVHRGDERLSSESAQGITSLEAAILSTDSISQCCKRRARGWGRGWR